MISLWRISAQISFHIFNDFSRIFWFPSLQGMAISNSLPRPCLSKTILTHAYKLFTELRRSEGGLRGKILNDSYANILYPAANLRLSSFKDYAAIFTHTVIKNLIMWSKPEKTFGPVGLNI